MRPKYIFSSRHTRRARLKFTPQKEKYPELAKKIINESDIILEILDARFPRETRNLDIEKELLKKHKKIIYVLNKSDLLSGRKSKAKELAELYPYVYVSAKLRKGIKDLRDKIKFLAKTVITPIDKDLGKINVGVIGYPNTGKSSLINILIGKNSAGTGSEAGFTKGLQKLRLTHGITLIDSPGIIPASEYSQVDTRAFTKYAKVGSRAYTQVKEPSVAVSGLMIEFPGIFEKYFNINANGDSDKLIEELGKRKGFLKKGNEVDDDRTSRFILKLWQEGEIKI